MLENLLTDKIIPPPYMPLPRFSTRSNAIIALPPELHRKKSAFNLMSITTGTFLALAFLQYFEHIILFPVTVTKLVAALFIGLVLANRALWQRPNVAVTALAACVAVIVTSSLLHMADLPSEGLLYDSLVRTTSLLQMVFLLYATYCFCSHRPTTVGLAWVMSFGGTAVAVLTELGYGLTYDFENRQSFVELDENIAGSLVAFSIVSAFGLMLVKQNAFRRVVLCICLLLLTGFLARTASRGAVLSTAVALVVLFYSSKWGRNIAWIAVGGAVVVWRILAQEELMTRWRFFAETGDTSNRNLIFFDSFAMFLERPWFGRGEVNAYFDLGASFDMVILGHHNQVLWAINSGGIVAGILLLIAGIVLIRTAWRTRARWDGRQTMAYAALLMVTCMSVEYHNMKLMWIMAGVIAALRVPPKYQEGHHETVPRRRLPTWR